MMNRDAEDDAFEVSSDSETVDSFSEEFEPVETPKQEPQAEDAEEARKKAEFDAAEAKRKPMGGGFGGDVPDELCYQWAREYFRDADAKEDAESEEKFVPKTYNGKTPKAGKKEKSKKTEPKPAPKPADEEQLTFGDFGTEEAAG